MNVYASSSSHNQRGFTLIELMISLLLGILVVIAVSSVFMSGRRAYGTTQGINRIQESQRIAFELMSSDIRSAGSYVCPTLADPVWQAGSNSEDWPETRYMLAVGLEGNSPLFLEKSKSLDPDFDSILLSIDSAASARSAGSEQQYYPIIEHKAPSDPLKLVGDNSRDLFRENTSARSYMYVVACNIDVAIVAGTTLGQITPNTINFEPGTGSRQRCGTGFSRHPPNDCAADPNRGYCFWGKLSDEISDDQKQICGEWSSSQAFVVNLADYDPLIGEEANAWYVDNAGNKGYLVNPARGGIITEGVTHLELRYRLRNTSEYLGADEIRANSPAFDFTKRQGVGSTKTPSVHTSHTYASDWAKVDSVYLKITFKSPDNIKGTDGDLLERSMETYIAVRSHMLEY